MVIYYANPILIAAAVIPALYLLYFVYKQDRLEKEPGSMLFSLILFGVFSTILASITEELGIAALPYMFKPGSFAYNVVLYFVVVAFSEEGFKYLILKFRTWKNPSFNCQFDGLVYSVFVSLGFAIWENIGYVASYGFSAAVSRAVTAIPGHACFGVFMGAFYGAAKKWEEYGYYSRSRLCRWGAFVSAVLLHGAYDFYASKMSENGEWVFVVFVIVMFIAAYKLVKTLSAKDSYFVS